MRGALSGGFAGYELRGSVCEFTVLMDGAPFQLIFARREL